MTKDSRISKENFLKINKEFRNSDFKKLRKNIIIVLIQYNLKD